MATVKGAVPAGVNLADFDVATIDQRAILVYCHLGKPGTIKENKELSSEVTANLGIDPGLVKVKQDSFPGAKELEEVIDIQREFRKFHYDKVTRYGGDGWGFMASREIDAYKKVATEAERRHATALDAFMAAYPRLIDDAKTRLKGAWRERDYPEPKKMKSKFAFDVSFKRVGESTNGLIGVSDDLRREIAAAAESRIRAGVASSVSDIAERISKVIGNVSKVLAERQPEGGKPGAAHGKIHASLISNIRELADAIPSLNVLDDPRFNQIAQRMRDELGKVEVDDLKESEAARKAVVKTAESIAADLAGIF